MTTILKILIIFNININIFINSKLIFHYLHYQQKKNILKFINIKFLNLKI